MRARMNGLRPAKGSPATVDLLELMITASMVVRRYAWHHHWVTRSSVYAVKIAIGRFACSSGAAFAQLGVRRASRFSIDDQNLLAATNTALDGSGSGLIQQGGKPGASGRSRPPRCALCSRAPASGANLVDDAERNYFPRQPDASGAGRHSRRAHPPGCE
jgi:hypothetical protein